LPTTVSEELRAEPASEEPISVEEESAKPKKARKGKAAAVIKELTKTTEAQVSLISEAVVEAPVVEEVVRGRRGRKAKVTIEPEPEVSTATESVVEAPKRGRGRAKKVVSQEETADTPESVVAASSPVAATGRTRTKKIIDYVAEQEVIEEKPKAKSTRGKKQPAVESQTVEEEMDQGEDVAEEVEVKPK